MPRARGFTAWSWRAPPSPRREWLEGIITRGVPLTRYSEAFEAGPTDLKTVLQLDSAIPD